MQHQVTKVKFGRNTNQRKALLRSLLRELILREKLDTSLEKAKWLKKEMDKLITAAKKNNILLVSKILNDNDTAKKLFSLVPRFQSRNSGYSRIYHLGGRSGDNSQIGQISLILDEIAVVGATHESPAKPKKSPAKKLKKNENQTTKSK